MSENGTLISVPPPASEARTPVRRKRGRWIAAGITIPLVLIAALGAVFLILPAGEACGCALPPRDYTDMVYDADLIIDGEITASDGNTGQLTATRVLKGPATPGDVINIITEYRNDGLGDYGLNRIPPAGKTGVWTLEQEPDGTYFLTSGGESYVNRTQNILNNPSTQGYEDSRNGFWADFPTTALTADLIIDGYTTTNDPQRQTGTITITDITHNRTTTLITEGETLNITLNGQAWVLTDEEPYDPALERAVTRLWFLQQNTDGTWTIMNTHKPWSEVLPGEAVTFLETHQTADAVIGARIVTQPDGTYSISVIQPLTGTTPTSFNATATPTVADELAKRDDYSYPEDVDAALIALTQTPTGEWEVTHIGPNWFGSPGYDY